MNSYHSYFFIAGKIDDLHFHTNCQCLSSNLFLPGNELLRPIEVVEEAALFSEDGNADCFDPLDALAEIAQDIDVDVHGTNLDPNPDLGVQFLQDLLEDGSSNTQFLKDAYSWVPLEMRQPGFLTGYKFSKRYSTKCQRGESVGNYRELNIREDRLVNSLGGVLSNSLGIWNKNHARFPTESNPYPKTKPGAAYEKLEEYSCLADGCNCAVVMYRVNGGLVFFEKLDSDGDIVFHDDIGKAPSSHQHYCLCSHILSALCLRRDQTGMSFRLYCVLELYVN